MDPDLLEEAPWDGTSHFNASPPPRCMEPPQKSTPSAHLLSWVVVVLGSSSLWLRLLRAVECWLAVVSKADADTPSLRGAILGAEGESDLTAGPVAPVNKELWVRGSSQRTVQS